MTDNPKEIEIAGYDYPLPDDRIAKYPLAQRDQSKILVYTHGEIKESTFCNITNYLDPNTLLVFNDTKVIHARLLFRKATGSTIEIFCLEPFEKPAVQVFESREECTWVCFVGNNKKWKEGRLERVLQIEGKEVVLTASRREPRGNAWIVDFRWSGSYSFAEIIESAGVIPLPPYLHREAEADDKERYQTVYAAHAGSVAAPTAGLHFTEKVFADLRAKGIGTEFITLDVGAGTFKPVSTAKIGDHEMHVEKIHITRSNIKRLLEHNMEGLLPVGTTTVRTLESVYWFGVKLQHDPTLNVMDIRQWDPYELDSRDINAKEAYRNVLLWMERNGIDQLEGATQLLIAPGYKYRVIHRLITNFHQPKSTLLLLVSALIGEQWRECYSYALDHGFRFLSYGDCCLFEP